jgi:hypothetical protein
MLGFFAVRYINVTYRGSNSCNQEVEARLYCADVGVRLKTGTFMAKSGFTVAATTPDTSTYLASKAIDTLNSSYYASSDFNWLVWWVRIFLFPETPPKAALL